MKRLLSFLLVVVMLFTTLAFTLTSCGEETTECKKPNPKPAPAPSEGDIFAERAAVDDELPDYDFGGRSFRVVSHHKSDIAPDPEKINQGNLITDAIAKRNQIVEDRFNVNIEVVYNARYDDVASWVTKTILSGADEFDLFSSHCASAGGIVLKNVFLNWYDIPNVDFSKPWWPDSNATDLTYDGKCILAVSDLNYCAVSGAYCMLFNKNLANSYDMGNLYEVVKNGDWTFDYFMNLVKDVYVDSDGDGNKSAGDFYGFQQHYSYGCAINSWLWAFDNPTVKKDEEGVPVVAVKTDKINQICATLHDMVYNTTGIYYDHRNTSEPNLFMDKKAIFTISTIGSPTGEGLRNFEDEYGLLPMPKWDEHQKDYHTMASGEHGVLAVPKTVKDTEFVGTIVEALSAESYKQVVPTLYEIALKTRYLRDNESKEVLDMINEGRTYEFGYIYGAFDGFGFMLSAIFDQTSPNFESYYAKRYKGVRLHFKQITKIFDKLD